MSDLTINSLAEKLDIERLALFYFNHIWTIQSQGESLNYSKYILNSWYANFTLSQVAHLKYIVYTQETKVDNHMFGFSFCNRCADEEN